MTDAFEEFYQSFEEPELTADEKELLAQMPEINEFGESRRKFLRQIAEDASVDTLTFCTVIFLFKIRSTSRLIMRSLYGSAGFTD